MPNAGSENGDAMGQLEQGRLFLSRYGRWMSRKSTGEAVIHEKFIQYKFMENYVGESKSNNSIY